MKQFSLRLIIALATLAIGVNSVLFLVLRNPLPTTDLPQYPPECASETDAEIARNFDLDWNWEFLTNFQEIPLKEYEKADETYRLLWVPTFDPPTVIRIWRAGDDHFITVKRLSRNQKNLKVGKLIVNETRSLTANQWNNFAGLLDSGCFWSVPPSIEELPVPDGASWTFEAKMNGDYRLVDRTLPSDYMKKIFRNLFKLTDIEMEYEDYL